MPGMPKVEFAIATPSPEAQQFFNQGVGQLHGFWYYEAERSFRQAALLDPQAAMPWWGMAMANVNNQGRAKGLIAKAAERKGSASLREAMWIDAWHAFYQADPGKDHDRRRQLVRSIEAIIHDFPEDVEAKAFLAYQIWANSGAGLPISSNQAVDSLIGEVLAANPMHPAHHYRIHLWDGEKPSRARASAGLGGQSGPGIAHLWHMPGHTYSGLQRYPDAVWQQEASARVDHAHMMRDRVMPYQIHNFAHNNEWLIRNLWCLGRANDAVSLAKNLVEIPRHPQYNGALGYSASGLGRQRLFESLGRFELWDEAIALLDSPYLEPLEDRDDKLRRARLAGAARFAKGEIDLGQRQIAELETLLAEDKTAQDKAGQEAEAKAKQENKPEAEIAKARDDARNGFNGRVAAVETALADLRGRLAAATGQFAAALEQFAKAPDLGKVLLSRTHMQAGDLAKAEQLAREAVDENKYQVLPLANYVEVLARAGKPGEVAVQFEALRALAADADLDTPPFARLVPIAQGLKMPADWRNRQPWQADSGTRPTLESLGPYRWRPSPAPAFQLADLEGRPVTLEQYRGRPVVVLFYLGFGCTHCVEQLKAFSPLTAQFAESGVSLLAVSTETPESLRAALEARKAEGGFPFPIVPNASLDAFKAFRAFDDFENQPLHATLLIDGEGLVRWQDIGYQPFADANFLLGEVKRLLKQPTNVPEPARVAAQ